MKTTATVNDASLRSSAYNQKNGRYVVGGVVSNTGKGLGWWEKREVAPDISDLLYVLEERYVGRPDLLAYAFYHDTKLWWVIPQFNHILDPVHELTLGKLLIIPSMDKINSTYFADNKVGGINE